LFEVLLASVPEDERRSSMHVVGVDGSVASAGDAVIRLMAVFPRTRWRAWVARVLPPVRSKVDREYRRLADRRGELSDRVPDAPPTVVRPGFVRLPGS
jgi:predicted DCC family thiol-disulfide oxidoreductase YuxK